MFVDFPYVVSAQETLSSVVDACALVPVIHQLVVRRILSIDSLDQGVVSFNHPVVESGLAVNAMPEGVFLDS
jgi:hypothetical protein